MLCHKKKIAGGKEEDDKPVDFLWLKFIGVTKLGFTWKTIGFQYYGLWVDLFEIYKKEHNFETKRGLYKLLEMEEVSSLDAI